jgi:RNA polymerase sigma-70 factor (ECF subfamily)
VSTLALSPSTPGIRLSGTAEVRQLRESAAKVLRMDSVDDGQLMRAYASGDLAAFEMLYTRHKGALYRYLLRHTRDAELANDLFQESWSKVVTSRERYEARAKFQTFLFTIAHNCFIDHCRRHAVRGGNAIDRDALEQDLVAAPTHERPEQRAQNEDLKAQLRRALDALPAEQRDVFLLYEEGGLSLEEIAAVTRVGAETAKSRLRYAVAKLREAMAPMHEDHAT